MPDEVKKLKEEIRDLKKKNKELVKLCYEAIIDMKKIQKAVNKVKQIFKDNPIK